MPKRKRSKPTPRHPPTWTERQLLKRYTREELAAMLARNHEWMRQIWYENWKLKCELEQLKKE